MLAPLCLCFLMTAAPADARLESLRSRLPTGWTMQRSPNQLVFFRAGKVHALFQNMISAPVSLETEAEREARIRKHGKETETRLTYRLEPRWSEARFAKAREANAAIDAKVVRLRQRALQLGAREDRKTGDLWPPEGSARAEVESMQREIAQLETTRLEFPSLQTKEHALFGPARSGVHDAFTLVSPASASQEAATIEELVRKACGEAERP